MYIYQNNLSLELSSFDIDNSLEIEPYSYASLDNLGRTTGMDIRMRRGSGYTYIGAVTACCYEPCSLKTLMSFCG